MNCELTCIYVGTKYLLTFVILCLKCDLSPVPAVIVFRFQDAVK